MSISIRSVSQLTTDANMAVRRNRARFKKISNQMSSNSGVAYTLPNEHTLADVTAFFEAHTYESEVGLYHRRLMIAAQDTLSPEGVAAVDLKIQLFERSLDLVKLTCKTGLYCDEFEKEMNERD